MTFSELLSACDDAKLMRDAIIALGLLIMDANISEQSRDRAKIAILTLEMAVETCRKEKESCA